MGNDIGKRIAAIRRDRGYNQDQLAEMAMISRITLARYETGVIEPGAFALSRIADALNVSTDELLCRTEKLPPFISIIKSAVPVIGSIACGTPITAEQNIDGYVDLPDGVRADFALKCTGDSMTPTFENGDFVLIRQQTDVQPGQIAAVGIGDDATLKRVYQHDNQIICVSDNPAFKPQIFPAENVTIYGIAVGFVRMWS
jgi:repressor LexA